MRRPDYNSPADLKRILEENGFSMQKKFGQNFLINGTARKKLVDMLETGKASEVWEVGPGLGAMTAELLARGARVTAFEIDRGFSALLGQFFEKEMESGQLNIIEGDVLKTWKKQLENGAKVPDRFFGNLPYNIAATLIADTIESGIRFDRCVFTVQKEVALRMCARPGTPDYSSFSVLCQWAYEPRPFLELGGGNFWPRPNVDSRAIMLVKKDGFPGCADPGLFVRLQHALFTSRRKTVRNNLSGFLQQDNALVLHVLAQAGIDPMRRAEVLSIEEMLRLSDILHSMQVRK